MGKLLKLVVSNTHGIGKDRYDPERDGVNPTLLSKWKKCREKARLSLLGWREKRISAGRIFGIICHAVLEEIYTGVQTGDIESIPTAKQIRKVIAKIEKKWRAANPRADAETLQSLEINLMLAEAVMPLYFTFWAKDLTSMDWLSLEHYFKTSNRSFGKYRTHLRGLMDGSFRSLREKNGRPWLFETKTKSRLGEHGESALVDIMPFETQTNLYLGVLKDTTNTLPGGILLNIIRRPNLKLKKNESPQALTRRIIADIKSRPDFYFIRLRMSVDSKDLAKARAEHDALITDFLRWWHGEIGHYRNSDMCEDKYGTCEFLKICSAQDYSGFYQVKPRHPNLEDA